MSFSRAFMGIGDSPVRSSTAGLPVNRWRPISDFRQSPPSSPGASYVYVSVPRRKKSMNLPVKALMSRQNQGSMGPRVNNVRAPKMKRADKVVATPSRLSPQPPFCGKGMSWLRLIKNDGDDLVPPPEPTPWDDFRTFDRRVNRVDALKRHTAPCFARSPN